MEALARLQAQIHQRWDVKTGADPDNRIDHTIVDSTIAELITFPPPTLLVPTSPRMSPVETTIYRLTAKLVGYKIESDGDYHCIISDDQQQTLITEIPDPATLDPGTVFRDEITAARTAFTARFALQLKALAAASTLLGHVALGINAAIEPPMISHVNVPVIVIGLGFFDFAHNATGAARNCVECHPVLSIEFP